MISNKKKGHLELIICTVMKSSRHCLRYAIPKKIGITEENRISLSIDANK